MSEQEPDDEYIQVQTILLAASHHDLESLRTLLRTLPANIQDPETGYSPLHAAIAGAAHSEDTSQNGHELPTQDDRAAEKTLSLLLQNGAVWNELDNNNETPGCLARRLRLDRLYEAMVDAGVRAELLLNRMDEYEPLADSEDEDAGHDQQSQGADAHSEFESQDAVAKNSLSDSNKDNPRSDGASSVNTSSLNARPYSVTNNREYLASAVRFENDKLLDVDDNGVMMNWETDIMKRTAEVLLPRNNLSILNIGHGMGIVDELFQQRSASEHHIVEAHPTVLGKMRENGWMERANVTVHSGRWQDVLPELVQQDLTFDAIFFDTFAESYSSFRYFFTEHVIALLKADGIFSFFHGLGADRQISYDVYTKVVEMDLFEAGFDTEWESLDTKEDSSRWDGVRRKYWALEKYRLPRCTFIG